MLIIGKDILDSNLLKDAEEEAISSASYYLRVHSVVPTGEAARNYDAKKPLTSHTIEPGALAWVVSKEVFCITDPGVTALVTLRSTFTKQGLLALDVGLVDVNYDGPIGTVVINFSKNDVRISQDDKFFRVIFFRHPDIPENFRIDRKHTHQEYLNERAGNMVSDFPAKFLQSDEIEDRVKESLSNQEVLRKLEDQLLDKLGTHLLKKHLWKILFGVSVLTLIAAIIAYLGISELYSKEELRELIRKGIEAGVTSEATSKP